MPLTEAYVHAAVTVGAAELSLVSGDTTLQTVTDDGMYQLWLDPSAMAKGDEFIIRFYEKVAAGGVKTAFHQATIRNAQAEIFLSPFFPLLHGWDITIQKVAGTDRAFDSSIRKVA